jgi:hypothetical protein
MFCTTCGAQIPAGSAYCHNCGRPAVTVPAAAPAAGTRTAVAGSGAPQTEPKAIISLVLGITGLFLFSVLAGIPAIILGHTARSRIRQSMGRLQGAGMALVGLILGYVSVAMIPLVVLLLFMGPHFAVGRSSEASGTPWGGPDESSGQASVRQIVVAAETYFATYPNAGYPERLSDLGGAGMEQSETNAGMLEEAIASGGPKDGYVFYYEPIDEQGDGFRENYFVRADPVSASAGRRSFCTDSRAVLRAQDDGACTLESAPVQ